jgi:hypothetical protein
MVVLEVRIDVARPVELLDQVIQVAVMFLRHILDEQRPRHRPPFDQVLIHAEDVRAPLGFVGAERARRVEKARAHQPAGAGLEPVGLREVQDAVVALVPIRQAGADLVLGGARLESEEGVGKVVAHIVVLGREVVGLRFAFLADEFRLFGALVHVMRDGPHVVEELRVDRPPPILAPDPAPDQGRRRNRPRPAAA